MHQTPLKPILVPEIKSQTPIQSIKKLVIPKTEIPEKPT